MLQKKECKMKFTPKSYTTKACGYFYKKYGKDISKTDGFARDKENIHSDWVAVGKDIKTAMGKVKDSINAEKNRE